jgi:hypothetical protein
MAASAPTNAPNLNAVCQFAPIASLNGSAKRPNGAPKLTLNETAWVDDLSY